MSLTATLRPEQTLLETAWRVGMPGKRVQFDDETWATIDALARRQRKSFQELSDEAFGDLLKKHRQPVGFKTALKESVAPRGKTR